MSTKSVDSNCGKFLMWVNLVTKAVTHPIKDPTRKEALKIPTNSPTDLSKTMYVGSSSPLAALSPVS